MNKILRYVILGGIFASLFLPLVVTNSLFFPFISGKNFAFRIIVEVITAAWLILMIRVPEYRPRKSLVLTCIAAFIGIVALADIFGVYSYKSFWSNFERMEGLVGFVHLFLYFLVVGSVARTEKVWGWIFHTSIGISLFVSLYALLQVGGELVINQGGLRVDATFGNAIYLAVYLLFHLFLVKKRVYGEKELFKSAILGSTMFLLYYLARAGGASTEAGTMGVSLSIVSLLVILFSGYALASGRDVFVRRARIAFEWVMIALYVTVIAYTATRGVVIGLGASLVVLGALLAMGRGEDKTQYRRIGAGILLFFVCAGAAFFVARDIPAVRDHKVFGRLASISFTNDDAQARFRVWTMALQGLKERPILGWGQENFNYVFNKYYSPEMYAREQWFDRTHNVFLDWAIAGGILGLLAYLSIFYALLRVVWKAPGGGSDDRAPYTLSYVEKSVLTAMVAGYFVQNMFVFDNLTSYLVFFLILSYVHFVGTSRSDSSIMKLPNEEALKVFALPVIAIVLVFSLYFVNIRPILAGSTLIKSLQPYPPAEGGPRKNLELFKDALEYDSFANAEIREQLAQVASVIFANQNVDQQLKTEFFDLSYAELKRQLEATPNDARYHLFMGVFLNGTGRYAEGVQALERAAELSPNKQTILFELGSAYLSSGNLDLAIDTFRRAYELEKNFSDARVIYAVGLIYGQKFTEAEALLKEKFGTAAIDDNRIIQAYITTKQFGKLQVLFEEKIAREPNNAEAHLQLAGVFLQTGNRSKAITEIQKAMEINPALKESGEQYIREIRAGNM